MRRQVTNKTCFLGTWDVSHKVPLTVRARGATLGRQGGWGLTDYALWCLQELLFLEQQQNLQKRTSRLAIGSGKTVGEDSEDWWQRVFYCQKHALFKPLCSFWSAHARQSSGSQPAPGREVKWPRDRFCAVKLTGRPSAGLLSQASWASTLECPKMVTSQFCFQILCWRTILGKTAFSKKVDSYEWRGEMEGKRLGSLRNHSHWTNSGTVYFWPA